jgi:uncharacterized protein YcbK (DUF882 family)
MEVEHVMLLEKSSKEVYAGHGLAFGRELVELADEIITAGKVHSPGILLSELLSKAGVMATARSLSTEQINPTSPAALFDVFTSNNLPGLREYFNRFFEIVTSPHSRIEGDLHPGDLLVCRALGEGNLAHVALIVTGEALRAKELASLGLRPDSWRPGLFVEVIDAGPFPHCREDKFARRVGDINGQLSHDRLILRISAVGRPFAEMAAFEYDVEYLSSATAGYSLREIAERLESPFLDQWILQPDPQNENESNVERLVAESPFLKGFAEDFLNPASAEDDPSAPRLLERETAPPSRTLYVQIDLKIVDGKNNELAPPCTGIFIPRSYKPTSAVDLILYLHGSKGEFPGNDKSIKEYWDGKKFPFFALREGLNDSGKNLILVAPTLGPKSETGILTNPGELNKYLGQVMASLKAYGPYKDLKQDPMVGSLILACHSGGGSPMLKLAKLKGSGGYADKIVQCWCFDSLYANKLDDPDDEKERKQKWLAGEWADWANSDKDAKLFVYSYDGRPTATSEKLKKKKFKYNNVCVVWSTAAVERNKKEKSKAGPHFWVPIAHWPDRLNNAPCKPANDKKEQESFIAISDITGSKAESKVGDAVTFSSGESLPIASGPEGQGEEYYDPNNSGNPLLDTSGGNRTKLLSKNFIVDELAKSGAKNFDKARIDPKLVDCLQAIRDYVGKSVVINSGYRSYKHNEHLWNECEKKKKKGEKCTVGKNSQHLSGKAADIKIAGMTGVEIAKAAIDVCGCKIAIGLGANFANVDVRGEFRVWNYGGASEEQIEEIRLYHREKCGNPAESEMAAFEYSVEALGSATTDYSLQEIAEGTLGKLPDNILAAILTKGEGDSKDLTDRVFLQKHPDLSGKTLDPKDPKQKALLEEWGMISRRSVKPVIWLRQIIDQLDRHRGDIPREFLLGWMAAESDGQVSTVSTLGERGYFQIMWQSGEAKSQLGLTEKEFLRLSSDREFSIEKGVQLAQTYRQHFVKKYPSVADGSDLLWRLAKGRHALPTALDKVLDGLVKAGMEITWQAVSQSLPKMANGVNRTLDFVAKLKPLADRVP